MRILLLGKSGQVGWELSRSLLPLGEVVAQGRADVDLADTERLRKIVRDLKPDIIVNAAAYTAVDKAEEEKELAMAINGTAPGVLAEEAVQLNALLVHYSTDYVFNGDNNDPYKETDKPDPVNVYGETKLAGERAVQSSGCDYLIFRTSWVYASRGHNFLLTILRLAKEREELSIVADQTGSPTSARLIADTTFLCLVKALEERRSGLFVSDIYHLTASGRASWHGFSEKIVKALTYKSNIKLKVKSVRPLLTVDYPTPARRPANSQLALAKLEKKFCIEMPDWQTVLELCVEEVM